MQRLYKRDKLHGNTLDVGVACAYAYAIFIRCQTLRIIEAMTIAITSVEIAKYRSELSSNSEALVALDAIEDCEGNLEDAAIALAIHVGQEPDTSEGWLESLAKRCRPIICQENFKDDLLAGSVAVAVEALETSKFIPSQLATLVAIYAVKTGANDFCHGFEEESE
ncbi:MAG: hypothetical protein KME17_02350 [Cyanosarcina radialis HA8281-LM2]|nr:hypothetical protein [Cyanosarcina radialis HA8281-LM2]